jgi:hypothetical protein
MEGNCKKIIYFSINAQLGEDKMTYSDELYCQTQNKKMSETKSYGVFLRDVAHTLWPSYIARDVTQVVCCNLHELHCPFRASNYNNSWLQ